MHILEDDTKVSSSCFVKRTMFSFFFLYIRLYSLGLKLEEKRNLVLEKSKETQFLVLFLFNEMD